MIEFSLNCSQGHTFDAWFPNSASFDDQRQRGLISCPLCGSADVNKALMTPHIGGNAGRNRGGESHDQANIGLGDHEVVPSSDAPAKLPAAAPPPAANPPSPEAVEKLQAMMVAMRKVQEHVKKNFDDVGDEFSEEARKMHYGEKDARGIYGQASGEEIEELIDEGVEIMPLPNLPELDS